MLLLVVAVVLTGVCCSRNVFCSSSCNCGSRCGSGSCGGCGTCGACCRGALLVLCGSCSIAVVIVLVVLVTVVVVVMVLVFAVVVITFQPSVVARQRIISMGFLHGEAKAYVLFFADFLLVVFNTSNGQVFCICFACHAQVFIFHHLAELTLR